MKTFSLRVPVNYDLSLAEAVRRGAPQTMKNSDIYTIAGREHSPTKHKAVENVIIVEFGRTMVSRQVIEYARNEDLSPADILTLLAVGENFPDLPNSRRRPFMDLVTMRVLKRNGWRAPHLAYLDGSRCIDLGWYASPWDSGFSFVFKKP